MIGYSNAISGYYGTMVFGHNNKAKSDNASGPEVIVGNYLTPITGYLKDTVILGQYNNTTSVLSTPVVIIAAGASGSGNSKNAIEIDTSQCKILHDLQLATDATAVNAITPPQDPNNVTQDDKTLVTVSHLTSSGIMKQEQHRFTTQPDLRYGTGQNITTDLGLTVPDWATEVILRIRIVDVDNFASPMTRRYNITIPIQPSDVSATWRGNLNIALPVLSNSIWTVVYYSGEFAIYQNVLLLEHAVDVKVVQGTPPTITVANSTTSFFLEGMDFKGVL